MTGFSIRIEVDDAKARRNLEELLARMANPRPFYQAVGNLLVASVGRNFQREAGPDGAPWTPLRPATIRKRQRRGLSGLAILRERGASPARSSTRSRRAACASVCRPGSATARSISSAEPSTWRPARKDLPPPVRRRLVRPAFREEEEQDQRRDRGRGRRPPDHDPGPAVPRHRPRGRGRHHRGGAAVARHRLTAKSPGAAQRPAEARWARQAPSVRAEARRPVSPR